jgi:hypothetical protein
MTKTTSELNVLQAMFLFLSLEFLSFPPEADFDIRPARNALKQV